MDELGGESGGALTNLKKAGAESLNRTPALLREASQCAGVIPPSVLLRPFLRRVRGDRRTPDFFRMFRIFSQILTCFSHFLGFLNHLGYFYRFFSLLGRFFLDFFWIFPRFWQDFWSIFRTFGLNRASVLKPTKHCARMNFQGRLLKKHMKFRIFLKEKIKEIIELEKTSQKSTQKSDLGGSWASFG